MQKRLKIFLPIVLASCALGANLTTQEQKESYSIGASTGSYVSNQLHSQAALGVKYDLDAVIEGFLDALKKQQKLKDEEIIALLNQRADKLNKIVETNSKAELDKNLKAGKEFMAKNAKNPDVKTTKSGLQYEILKLGMGEKPKPESVVVMNYKAYLTNGSVFDDTFASKIPAHLSMIGLIDGLREGLLLMNTGSKYKFTIPSNLAYGNVDVDRIPAGSVVIFEAELLKVLKPGELADAAKKLSESEAKSFHDGNKTK